MKGVRNHKNILVGICISFKEENVQEARRKCARGTNKIICVM